MLMLLVNSAYSPLWPSNQLDVLHTPISVYRHPAEDIVRSAAHIHGKKMERFGRGRCRHGHANGALGRKTDMLPEGHHWDPQSVARRTSLRFSKCCQKDITGIII